MVGVWRRDDSRAGKSPWLMDAGRGEKPWVTGEKDGKKAGADAASAKLEERAGGNSRADMETGDDPGIILSIQKLGKVV